MTLWPNVRPMHCLIEQGVLPSKNRVRRTRECREPCWPPLLHPCYRCHRRTDRGRPFHQRSSVLRLQQRGVVNVFAFTNASVDYCLHDHQLRDPSSDLLVVISCNICSNDDSQAHASPSWSYKLSKTPRLNIPSNWEFQHLLCEFSLTPLFTWLASHYHKSGFLVGKPLCLNN